MRPLKIVMLGTLGLALVFMLPELYGYVLYAMAAGPLALLMAGQFILPQSKRAIQVWFNPIVLELDGDLIFPEPGTPVGRLSGKILTYSCFRQRHEFTTVTYRFWLLAAIGLASFGFFWFAWWVRGLPYEGVGFFYAAAPVWVLIVWLAWRWIWERRMLRLEGVCIGSFSVKTSGTRRCIRYHFVDPSGEHRGGTFESIVCDRDDDMTIVFYDEGNPDRSVPASGLIFHKLVWSEQQTSNHHYVNATTLSSATGMDRPDAATDDPSE